MIKLLRTIRFDDTDARVFSKAAEPGEWACSGTIAFMRGTMLPASLTGKDKQAFSNGFLGLASFGRSTFATVGEVTADAHLHVEQALAVHLVAQFGAPDLETALQAARDEISFAVALCRDVPINTVFTVRRLVDASGEVREQFRQIKAQTMTPSGEAAHARLWSIEREVGDGA